MPQNQNPHYLDAYSDWAVAHINATGFYSLEKTMPIAIRTLDLMQERVDARQLKPTRAEEYVIEMEKAFLQKKQIFLN